MTNLPGFGELTGGTVPVRIWTDYMEAALKGQKVLEFPERAGVGDDKVPTPTTTTTSSSTSSSSTTTSTTTSSTTTTTTPGAEADVSKTKKPPKPTLTTQPTGTGTQTILSGGARADDSPP